MSTPNTNALINVKGYGHKDGANVQSYTRKLQRSTRAWRWTHGELIARLVASHDCDIIEKMEKDPDFKKNIAKRERLMLSREKAKLERVIGGIAELNRLPAALFVIDTAV